jgi:hypothetical protein
MIQLYTPVGIPLNVDDLVINVEPMLDRRAMLVRPVGLLTRRNRHHLRAAVLKCLAECPTAVVIDRVDLELVDGIAAAVFVALSREAAVGPGINLLQCRAGGFLARRLRELDPWQPRYPTLVEAIDAIDDAQAVRNWLYRQLPPGPESESIAGCLVADACAAWNVPHLIHDMRAVMYDLLRDAYRCPTTELHVIVSQRASNLLFSVRSHITRHRVDCKAELESRRRPDPFDAAGAAAYHHTVTVSDHIGWALAPVITV